MSAPRSAWDELTPLDAARRSEATALAGWLEEHGERTAAELGTLPVPPNTGEGVR